MAIWQISFFILPKAATDASLASPFYKDSNGFFDDSPFWERRNIHSKFFEDLQSILPKMPSWDNEVIMYGHLESNVIEILSRNDKVISVTLRIHCNSFYEDILMSIIDFCMSKELVIVNNELSILPMSFEKIKFAIKNYRSQN